MCSTLLSIKSICIRYTICIENRLKNVNKICWVFQWRCVRGHFYFWGGWFNMDEEKIGFSRKKCRMCTCSVYTVHENTTGIGLARIYILVWSNLATAPQISNENGQKLGICMGVAVGGNGRCVCAYWKYKLRLERWIITWYTYSMGSKKRHKHMYEMGINGRGSGGNFEYMT